MGAVLVERFLKNTMGTLGPFNVHRLIITSLMIAMKQYADVFGVNKHFSKNLSMPTSDLNRMERVFLRYLDWETVVSSDQLAVYIEEKLLGRRARVQEEPLSPLIPISEASESSECSDGERARKTKSGNLGRLAKAIQYVRQRRLVEECVPEQKKIAQTPDHKRAADSGLTMNDHNREADSGLTTATW